MSRTTVGLVDYGVGNHASVSHALRDAGFRVRVTADAQTLDSCDVLLLPGVGAFKAAMRRLCATGMDDYVYKAASGGRALLGICLGMQLLAEESSELGHCKGLGILPGKVVPLDGASWHIGWNMLESEYSGSIFRKSHGKLFYFNHSFKLREATGCDVALARQDEPLIAAVRRGNVAGLQFHPEKSQEAGISLLHRLIVELASG